MSNLGHEHFSSLENCVVIMTLSQIDTSNKFLVSSWDCGKRFIIGEITQTICNISYKYRIEWSIADVSSIGLLPEYEKILNRTASKIICLLHFDLILFEFYFAREITGRFFSSLFYDPDIHRIETQGIHLICLIIIENCTSAPTNKAPTTRFLSFYFVSLFV